ncbi:MAG TPA: hypothetical protein VK279_06990 [Solirubrobacteraceae bacterium]|nr:hypothetical protein [Solirubrobacteraceae bacterium]
MGLFRREQPRAEGRARVVMVAPTARGAAQTGRRNVEFDVRLEVALAGRAPYDAIATQRVPHDRVPLIGDEVAVSVAADDPADVRVDFDSVRSLTERARAAAAAGADGDGAAAARALGFRPRDPD